MKDFICKNRYSRLVAVVLSLLSVFINGIVKINTNTGYIGTDTYTRGFPVSWFEFNKIDNTNLSLNYIISNWNINYRIDFFAFAINTFIIYKLILFAITVVKKGNNSTLGNNTITTIPNYFKRIFKYTLLLSCIGYFYYFFFILLTPIRFSVYILLQMFVASFIIILIIS